MCARLDLHNPIPFFEDADYILGAIERGMEFSANYNLAPSQNILTLTNRYQYINSLFGFVPHWSDKPSIRPVNARSETVVEKPMFREAIRTKRALIPVNGYYEWQQMGKVKQPYYIKPKEQAYFAFGAIYDEWYDNSSDEVLCSSAIITTTPTEALAEVHDRMPLILPKEHWQMWLDEQSDMKDIFTLMKPANDVAVDFYPVSSRVNSSRYSDASLIEPSVKSTLF